MKREVLLVTDDGQFRTSVLDLLGDEYQVLEAATPVAAVTLLTANPAIRVLILDLSFNSAVASTIFDYLGDDVDAYRVIIVSTHIESVPAKQATAHNVFNYIPKSATGSQQTILFTIGQAFGDLERSRLRERLAVAERNSALSLLVSAVAHEINNTSGVIPANVNGIRDRLGTPDPHIEGMLNVIENAAFEATEFARELAGFSRTRVDQPKPLDINRVITDAVSTIRSDVERRTKWQHVQLVVDLAPTPLICEIYPMPFAQVVRNILINAYQALEHQSSGVIHVSTAVGTGQRFGTAVVSFHDNGVGIKPEHMERVFDANFTTKPTGSGIGLWLSRTQLELVAGRIHLESAVNEGTTFTVTLPLLSDTGDHRS